MPCTVTVSSPGRTAFLPVCVRGFDAKARSSRFECDGSASNEPTESQHAAAADSRGVRFMRPNV